MKLRIALTAALLSAPAYAQAPAATPASDAKPAFTGVTGTVTDAKTGEPLIECVVKVTAGVDRPVSATTDLEGHFSLPLPPGKYDLRVWYELYQGVDVKGLTVVENGNTVRDLKLAPIEAELGQEETVVAKVDTRSESGLTFERKRANTVSDVLSAQELSRSPDSSAADAVKRVPSVTVLPDRTVVMRGLSGRYAAATVNGVALPSPDPDGHSVPLDLFPTGLLEHLTVQKSYSAELPGSFAGGLLSLDTNSYPESFRAQAKLTLGADSETTLQHRLGYQGGALDALTFDDGTRSLPAGMPSAPVSTLSSSAVQQLAHGFNEIWDLRAARGLPNFGVALNAGDTLSLGGKRLGYLAQVQYGHKDASRDQTSAVPGLDADGGFAARDTFRSTSGSQAANLGALLNLGYHLSDEDEVGALVLFSRSAESTGQQLSGYSVGEGSEIAATRLQFNARQLWFNQLRGYHALGEAGLKWQANYSLTSGSEPDTRDLTYYVEPDGTAVLKSGSRSAERVFTQLYDHSGGASAELKLPLGAIPLRVGASAQLSARQFDSRRLRFDFIGSDPSLLEQPASELLTAERLGTDFQLRESTQPEDSYRALSGIYAAYTTTELSLGEKLRLVPGLRAEISDLHLTSGSALSLVQRTPQRVDRTRLQLLPSLNAVYALTPRANLRASYSYTVARPQFRELGPFIYYDVVRRRSVTGDPNLLETRVHNGDLRWEWFASETELLAASAFVKSFQDPIEQKVVNESGDLRFQNTPSALSGGLELEARGSLGVLHPALRAFRAGANLSLIASRVRLDAADGIALETSRVRPLQGQSPYVANVNLGWVHEATGTEVTALYNVAGPRISEVGLLGLPDVLERPFHRLDLTVSQRLAPALRLKLSGTNLLDQRVSFQQGGFTVLEYRPGVAANAALEWTLQ